ncbi:hypothetical protein BDV95DRAFT_574461 [Massariosphaeria phaeospora]|uniref:Uncharacterized protein n=1 Tax=Massariosphaeria phaeospora TaxID=100035 RepID=A0A7C8I6S3_9PLEO|nr:hypothetical protein BDV95DRAFT_574461 [Massariosphaeria phaeospora]
MSTTAAPPHLNGNSVAPAEVPREAEFLAKLLQIRDQVLASKHARIQLPPKALEQVAPRPPQHTPPTRPTTNGTLNGAARPFQPFSPRPDPSPQQYQKNESVAAVAQAQHPPATTKSALSGIDPVLLTKSDHLIRAELQLRRQQIERTLKDQVDRKSRGNDMLADERGVDVEGILTKAQELVKPLSGLQTPPTNSEGAESFDENSYYSSKADSWSSEGIDSNQNASADVVEPLILQASKAPLTIAKPSSRPKPQTRRAEPPVIDLEEEAYEPADDIEIYEPELANSRDEAEESDYSPPPAAVGPSEPSRPRIRHRGPQGPGATNGSTRRQSPTTQHAALQNNKKRRRDEKREERRRQQQANKRVVRSPEPYIKEEPQSPPPFAAYSDPQPNKRRALQPIINNAESVSARQGARMQPVYHREQEPSSRLRRQQEEPLSPSVIHTPQRRVERNDHDLRRVASLQHARRPLSPVGGDLYAAPEPRQIRAASHAFADRPLEQPVYREASIRPSAAPRYVRERSQSPIYEYVPRPQSPVMMAPPPRRIVVDQFGNQFYASPADGRESAAPPSRRMELDPYPERAITREPTIRAPVRPELYEAEDGLRMPPPPRRYIEASDADLVETRPYRPREVSHRPVDVSYRPQEVLERRPIMQYEEMGPPRQVRAYSVRPEVVRQEVPEGYVRHESIQPSYTRVAAPRYREMSVVRQDPYDDPGYGLAAPPGRRYVEEGPSEIPIEIGQEPYAAPRRVSYRY